MKVLCSVILLLGVVATCQGYSYLIPASQNQDGVCYFNGHVLPKGNTQMPTSCQRLQCNDDGSVLVQGCGRLNIKDCVLLGPTKKTVSYPDCCEMNYECKDRDGRLYMKQWNQLKDEGGRGDQEAQNVPLVLQQTSENINDAKRRLVIVRRQVQRDRRLDLNGQIDRVDSEMRILQQIIERQAQQIKRGILSEDKRQALDQERRIQLARMEEELSTLVKMSRGELKLSEDQRLKMEQDAEDEVKQIFGLIQKELKKQDRLEVLKPKVVRLEGTLQKLAKLRVQQAQQIQQGVLDDGERDQQNTQIWTQSLLVEKELNSLLQMWTQGMDQDVQLEQVQNSLDFVVEQMKRHIRFQSPEVRAQLDKAQAELEILFQIRTRLAQQRIISEVEQQEQNKEIDIQRGRVDRELRILAQKWTRQNEESQPITRILRLIREQISRQLFLQPPESNHYVQGFIMDIYTLERISEEDQNQEQDQEIGDRRILVEKEFKNFLQMLIEGLRQVSGLNIQIEQDILSILQSVRDQFRESRQLTVQGLTSQQEILQQMGTEFDQLIRNLLAEQIDGENGIYTRNIRIQVNRVQNKLQVLELMKTQQVGQGEQWQKKFIKQKARLIQEMRGLWQNMTQRRKQSSQGDENRLMTEFGPLMTEVDLQRQVKSVEEQFKILEETKLQTQDQSRIIEQRWRVEGALKRLLQIWSFRAEVFGESNLSGRFGLDVRAILDLVGGGIRSEYQSVFPRLRTLFNRIEDAIRRLEYIGSVQEKLDERKQVEQDVWTLLQIFGQEIGRGDECGLIGQELQLILSMVKFQIEYEESDLPDLDLLGEINSVDEELQTLAEIYARQVREVLEGRFNQDQQEEQRQEIKMQVRRVRRTLMTLLHVLNRKLPEGKRIEGQFQGDEKPRIILELVKNRLKYDESLRSDKIRKQLIRVEQKLRLLSEVMNRQAQEGDLNNDEAKLEIGVEVEISLINLLHMILEKDGQGEETQEEARGIIYHVTTQSEKLGQRQVREGQLNVQDERQDRRDNQVIDRQIKRVQKKLLNLDQLERQGQLGERGLLRQKEKKQQQEQLELGLRTLFSMIQQGEQRNGQQSTNSGIVKVKLFKNRNNLQSEVFEREVQSLEQLQAQRSRVSEAERAKLDQQILAQRDRIVRELRSLFQIQLRQPTPEEWLSGGRSVGLQDPHVIQS